MTFRGRVQGNTIILDQPIGLPDGTVVQVTEIDPGEGRVPSMLESLAEFAGCIDDLPEDFAENHDHYIHGTPKRVP
jgi:hypothetical protein